jgi:two-component system NarL family sensor kinase
MQPRGDVGHGQSHAADPIVFGVACELVSHVVRHSRATRARITLEAADGMCRLDVIDDGIGTSDEKVQRGHRASDTGHDGNNPVGATA